MLEITAPGTDPSYIVDRIKMGVLDVDLDNLIKEFYQICDDDSVWGCSFSDSNRMIELWDKLVNESDERIQRSIIRFIISEQENEVCDFVILTKSAARRHMEEDDNLEICTEMKGSLYSAEFVLYFTDAEKTTVEDGMRVGIDRASMDQKALTEWKKKLCRG